MKSISWKEYYEGFYDWSFSTQKNYSYGLIDFGPAEEVFEVILEFALDDNRFAGNFMKKAVDAGVRFTFEQLEEIYISIDKDTFSYISEKCGIDIFADDVLGNCMKSLEEIASLEIPNHKKTASENWKKTRNKGILLGIFSALAKIRNKKKQERNPK